MIIVTIIKRDDTKEFYEFANKLAAGKFLSQRSVREIAVIDVYSVEEKMNGEDILKDYLQQHKTIKASAMSKLTDEEKAVLGL